MRTRGFWQLEGVSDAELVTSLKGLVGRSAWTEARLVAHLAELETRRLHLTAARSLFAYCQVRLGLSQNEAYYRIVAARMGQKFPIVFELLEQGKVHLTALALIRDHVTADNHLELLEAVSGKTKEQILRLLAARAPRPDARSHIRKLPVRAGSTAAGPSGRLETLSETSYRLELRVGTGLKQKLELLADLMSHANPSRDLAVIVERALDGLILKLQQRRFGQTARPRSAGPVASRTREPGAGSRSAPPTTGGEGLVSLGRSAPLPPFDEEPNGLWVPAPPSQLSQSSQPSQLGQLGSQADAANRVSASQSSQSSQSTQPNERSAARNRAHIPHELRRRLTARDGASCSFVCDDGRRCGAQAFLQIHHDEAWAKGGPETFDNLRLVCAAHNRLLAEQEFGARRVRAAIAFNRRTA